MRNVRNILKLLWGVYLGSVCVTVSQSWWSRGKYDGRKVTIYTTHQWYVVLEVFCVVYVGKPPTTHVGGVKWYVVLEVFCVVYVGKPPTRHVGWRCKMVCRVCSHLSTIVGKGLDLGALNHGLFTCRLWP